MTDTLDDIVAELQSKIDDDTRKRYGPVGYDRWKNMKFAGVMDAPDGRGDLRGSCGDTMHIFLRFEDGRVAEASYSTDGCGSSQICGSFAAELAHGKTPDELADFQAQSIIDLLGGLPEEDMHCAHLAAEALKEAVGDYLRSGQKPT
ncbi:MAG: iron-sulfur cluster assembly scaffold protein [Desulfovibrionaceae bacterium]